MTNLFKALVTLLLLATTFGCEQRQQEIPATTKPTKPIPYYIAENSSLALEFLGDKALLTKLTIDDQSVFVYDVNRLDDTRVIFSRGEAQDLVGTFHKNKTSIAISSLKNSGTTIFRIAQQIAPGQLDGSWITRSGKNGENIIIVNYRDGTYDLISYTLNLEDKTFTHTEELGIRYTNPTGAKITEQGDADEEDFNIYVTSSSANKIEYLGQDGIAWVEERFNDDISAFIPEGFIESIKD